MKAENAPSERQSVFDFGLAKLKAKIIKIAEFKITNIQSPYPLCSLPCITTSFPQLSDGVDDFFDFEIPRHLDYHVHHGHDLHA